MSPWLVRLSYEPDVAKAVANADFVQESAPEREELKRKVLAVIDAAVTYGAGMRHMLEQFVPALKLPWMELEAPELTDELIDRVVEGCEHQAAGRSIDELMARRDEFLSRLPDLVSEYWPENEGIEGCI